MKSLPWLLAALVLAVPLAAGCGRGDPPQPTMTEDQIKELMKKGREDATKERGNRYGPPPGAPRQ